MEGSGTRPTERISNPDAMYDPDHRKTKAVRKMVQLIIEKEGGEVITIQKDIVADYKGTSIVRKSVCGLLGQRH